MSLRSSLRRALRGRLLDGLVWLIALVTVGYVVCAPLLVARYPMMTDLPFHAANASILRHYFDPSWHFQEQFRPQLLAVPYLSFYLVAAVVMSFTSAVTAIKVATAVMLACLPIGLAVLCRGMGKSPLLGVLGCMVVWGSLTHWGFINYVGAIGLFALATGLAFLQLRRPRRRTAVGLFVALAAVFFTHPFRFPFAIAAVVAAAILLYPSTHRLRPVVMPVVGALFVFFAWWLVKPPMMETELWSNLTFDAGRAREWLPSLYGSLSGPEEGRAVKRMLLQVALLFVLFGGLRLLQGRERSRRARSFGWGAHGVVAGSALVFLAIYFTFPTVLGGWWYVWPREATPALFLALALLPDLPRGRGFRLLFVGLAAGIVLPFTQLQVRAFARFDEATKDFTAAMEHLPHAPKLLYLVFDRSGAPTNRAVFMHLPAYVQAERGGWLSFHFADFGATPMAYRPRDEPGAMVPPQVPVRWEWTPEVFDPKIHGAFFDWVLVRSKSNPSPLMFGDPSLQLVAREGTWWIFHRERFLPMGGWHR